MSNSIAAIIVTYNRKKMLGECIQCVLSQKSASCDLLIIDNASTDGTQEYISPWIDNVRVFRFSTGNNLGGAGGFQYGIRKAYEMGYEYFWLMDDDTKPDEYALKNLLEEKNRVNDNYGFLSSKVVWKDGTLCCMNIQKTGMFRNRPDFNQETQQIVMATFVSFFTKREIIRDVGLPIKEYFIWSDDLEYSRRISRKYPCYYVPGSRVLHDMAKNEKVGIESESDDRLWRYYYLYRNEVYLYRREGVKGQSYMLARVLLHSFRVLAKKNTVGRRRKLSVIWKSYMKGFSFKPEIEFL